ncbi:hypothetical protein HDU67_007189, partial [Dinochytrium kinnereticum]
MTHLLLFVNAILLATSTLAQKCTDACTAATQVASPVCGTDGKTYPTSCHLTRAACTNTTLAIASKGTCKECPDICPAIYGPICGSDGKTYGNSCEFSYSACFNTFLAQVMNGECSSTTCIKTCVKDLAADVVCGSDGKTYMNLCELENMACGKAGLVKFADGACAPGMVVVVPTGSVTTGGVLPATVRNEG